MSAWTWALLARMPTPVTFVWLQLLFAFTLDGEAAPKSSTTALKGLGLAVRGALESICGEAASTLVPGLSPEWDPLTAFLSKTQVYVEPYPCGTV